MPQTYLQNNGGHIYEGMYLMPNVCVCVCVCMVCKHGQHLWVLKIVISIITIFKRG